MSYGNTSELWFVQERNKELKYTAMAFASERAALTYATENCSRLTEFSIYSAKLIGHIVLDEPRYVAAGVDGA
jgi:hypothetical protein